MFADCLREEGTGISVRSTHTESPLCQCVIRRQLDQVACSKKKRLRVSDIRDEDICPGYRNHCQARRETGSWELAAGLTQGVICQTVQELDLLLDACGRFLVDAKIPFSVLNGQIREGT